MPASWIVEAIDVFEDGHLGVATRWPGLLPEQLSFDGLEEGVSGPKVVPKDLQDLYAEASVRKRVAEYERKLRAEPSPRAPYGLRDTIAEMLSEDPDLSWDEALAKLV